MLIRGDAPVEKPPPILGYRPAAPPTISGFTYVRVTAVAIIQLLIAATIGIFATLIFFGGIIGLLVGGHPADLPCAGIVWGPIVMFLAVRWFTKAVEVLAAGRTYNRHY